MRVTACRRFGLPVIAGTAMSVASFICAAQAPAPEYSLKSEQPPIGSRILNDAAHTTRIPINLTYQQLTPDQRAIINSWYEEIAPGDEPPFPLEGTKSIIDAVRKAQEKLLVTRKLYLVATVEPNGKVSTVKAYDSADPEMTKFASKVLLLTKFKPAICGGLPCRMDFPLRYHCGVK